MPRLEEARVARQQEDVARRISDTMAIAVMITVVLLLTMGAGYALGAARPDVCPEVVR